MRKLLIIIGLLGCFALGEAQDRVSQWKGTVTTGFWIANKKVLGAVDVSAASVCVYDSAGGPVQVAFTAADTAAADGSGYSNFATIPAGATFNFPFRATTTVYLKAVGATAYVTVTRY